jgi:hypothetical protein
VDGTGVIDYEISRATSQPIPPPAGHVRGKDGRWTTTPDTRGKTGDDGPWLTRVVVRRLGSVAFPIDVELTWEDGRRETVPWDGRGTWTRIERVGPTRLRSAIIDPRNQITLEVNRVNNGKRLRSDPRLAVSWTARWMFWLQNILAGGGL